MNKKIIPVLASTLLLLAGCSNETENRDHPIEIRFGENIKTEYRKDEEFVAPDIYSVFPKDKNLEDVKLEKGVIIEGYDMSTTGRQEVKVSYKTLNEQGENVTLTKSYNIYVYGYDAMPNNFKNVEPCFKEVLTTFYDLNEVYKISSYSHLTSGEECLNIIGTASLEGTTFTEVFQEVVNKFDASFIRTSFIEAGYIETGEAAYQISYTENTKNYDFDVVFVNKGDIIGYEANFYLTNKITNWPEYTVSTIVSWITTNEETVPQIEGDLYSFNVKNFSEFGVATVNTFTQVDPTTEYEAKLQEAGYTLFELPENYVFFFTKLALSRDKEIVMEYGFENGVFTIALTPPQGYEFDSTKANKLITTLIKNSTTVVPALDNAYIYNYYPELINTASVTAFRAYTTEDKLETLFNDYKAKVAAANWEITNNGEPDDEGGYSYISPNRDIRVNIVINPEEKAVEVVFSIFIDSSEGWPFEEIASLLTSQTTETVPPYEGDALSFSTFNDWFTGFIVYVDNGKESEAKAEYIETIEKLGYEYSEEETANHYNDPTYVSPNGQILLTVYSTGTGSFTVDVTCTIEELGEVGLKQFLEEIKFYDENAAAFIESTKGKYLTWESGSSARYDYYEAVLEGDVTDEIGILATAIGLTWHTDKEPNDWFDETLNFQIGAIYNSETDTTSIVFIKY